MSRGTAGFLASDKTGLCLLLGLTDGLNDGLKRREAWFRTVSRGRNHQILLQSNKMQMARDLLVLQTSKRECRK